MGGPASFGCELRKIGSVVMGLHMKTMAGWRPHQFAAPGLLPLEKEEVLDLHASTARLGRVVSQHDYCAGENSSDVITCSAAATSGPTQLSIDA